MKLAKPDMLHSLRAGPQVMVSKNQANTAPKQKSVSVNFVSTLELQFSAATEYSARSKALGDGSSGILMLVQQVACQGNNPILLT